MTFFAQRLRVHRVLMTLASASLLACDSRHGEVGVFVDGGRGGDATPGDGDGYRDGGWQGDGDGQGSGDACIRADVKASRKPPTVWLLLDYSVASSNGWSAELTNSSAWGVTRDLLIGDGGIIGEFQASVRFGAALPGSKIDDPMCGQVPAVAPALNNLAAIEAQYPEIIDKSLSSVIYYGFKYILQQLPEKSDGPVAIVLSLAQDGDHLCVGDWLSNAMFAETEFHTGTRLVDGVVEQLAAKGVTIYGFESGGFGMVSGGATPTNQRLERIDQLAGTGRGPIPIDTPEILRDQLASISAELISCNVQLNGKVTQGQECSGTVSVDGKELPCNDPNGWRMASESTLEITGTACADLKMKPMADIHAAFACDAFVLF